MAKLYETINAENWWKYGALTSHTQDLDSHCLGYHMAIQHPMWAATKEDERIADAIIALFPDRIVDRSAIGKIIDFNDHPDTTLDDVLRVCKLADV